MNKVMTAEYIQLNQGFWGLVDENGTKYEPINMPEQLKKTGKRSRIWYEIIPDVQSLNMHGELMKIEGFSVE